ncbi:1-phosphatidylinositol 4-5-bisphosphate phosphodiesterase delta-3-A [Nymphaea thermarum]|nr:1-phosphatidylinositol 4-5-bisphosphate phosphodiesterase delta-3-A [Nymphaea thermarum]
MLNLALIPCKNLQKFVSLRTLTTPVELLKCLKSIQEHAFSASPYPVVVTLEDHLTADLQAKIAQMVTETFGDMLFYPESGSLQKFPSPESLKYRILISTKGPKEYLEASSFKNNGSQSQKGKEKDEHSWGKEVRDVKEEIESDAMDDVDTFQLHPGGDDEDDDNKLSEYTRIITIHAGKLRGGMKNGLKIEENVVSYLSLSEQELAKAIATHPGDLVRSTQHNLLRVYPKGIRVDSSNYNPLIGWMYGAQLVALNMQGYGRSLWMMHGFFKANGSCGYLKKPDFLLNNGPHGKTFDPQAKLPVKKTLKVMVYMGDGWNLDFKKTHFDTYSPPDFYTSSNPNFSMLLLLPLPPPVCITCDLCVALVLPLISVPLLPPPPPLPSSVIGLVYRHGIVFLVDRQH